MPSFDAVSRVNMQEVDNALNQARKEISTRYDFRNTNCEILFQEEVITLVASDKMKLQAMQEILQQKMSKRGVSVRSLDEQEPEGASGGTLRQKILIKQGISGDDARKIVKLIKDLKLKKVQAQIQDDQVRVNGPKKDDLQQVMTMLRREMTDVDLQFVNFKDS